MLFLCMEIIRWYNILDRGDSMYEVKLEVFEGPMDLLLHLITDQKLDIYNIPIHKITMEYMNYLENLNRVDVNVASEFLVMAATLLEIKSKMLLPDSELDPLSEDLMDQDPRTELVVKLLEFKKYKKASGFLAQREAKLGALFYKEPEDLSGFFTKDTLEELNKDMEVSLLVEAMKRVLANIDRMDVNREVFFQKLHREAYSVEEKMEWIESLMLTAEAMPFSALFGSEIRKAEVIATFLAILELLKLKKVSVTQASQFDEIQIQRKN